MFRKKKYGQKETKNQNGQNHILGAEVKMQKVCNYQKFMSLYKNICNNFALSQSNTVLKAY